MANSAVFSIDVPGLEKLQEAGELWKGLSKGGKMKVKAEMDRQAKLSGLSPQEKKYFSEMEKQAAKETKQKKDLWRMTSMTLSSFTRSLMSWSKWAVAGVAGGLFGLGRLAAGVKADMQQGKATGTNTGVIMAWEKTFKDLGLGGEGAGTSYLRAIREMQTDLQKQAYFANLGMQTGPDIKGQNTEKIALEFMQKLRDSNLPAQLKDEMASAVGLSRIDLERLKGGEFEGTLNKNAQYKIGEGTAQSVAAFAQQLDDLTASIKTNFIKVMGKYSGELTAFVKKINEGVNAFAKYILTGQFEDDLRKVGRMLTEFGYGAMHIANKFGAKIYGGEDFQQYERGREFKDKLGGPLNWLEISAKNAQSSGGGQGTAAQIASQLSKINELTNQATNKLPQAERVRVLEGIAGDLRSMFAGLGFDFKVTQQNDAGVARASLTMASPSSGTIKNQPFKAAK